MKQPLVTIIVPVYNVEPYLGQCLESIRTQTYSHFQCILVNDGSTDGSGAICRTAAAGDTRFVLVEQKNAGVSEARNAALELAEGEYLQFADGDDYLAPEATATFVHTAQATGCDLAVSHFIRLSGQRRAQRGHIKTGGVMTRQEYAGHMVKAPANYYYGVLWNKFYRRSMVEASHLRFQKDVSWCEDFLFNLDYIACARLIASIPQPLYYYRKREDSLVNTQTTLRRMIQTKRDTFAAYKELYRQLDLYDEQKAKIYTYLLSLASDGTTLTPPAFSPRRGQGKLREERSGEQK